MFAQRQIRNDPAEKSISLKMKYKCKENIVGKKPLGGRLWTCHCVESCNVSAPKTRSMSAVHRETFPGSHLNRGAQLSSNCSQTPVCWTLQWSCWSTSHSLTSHQSHHTGPALYPVSPQTKKIWVRQTWETQGNHRKFGSAAIKPTWTETPIATGSYFKWTVPKYW